MNSIKDEQIREAIGERATEWFVHNRGGEMTAAEKRDFMQWLKASPQHVDAYLKLVDLTGKLGSAVSKLKVDKAALYERARIAAAGGSVVVPFAAIHCAGAGAPQVGSTDRPQARSRFRRMFVSAAVITLALVGAAYLGAPEVRDMLTASWSAEAVVVPHGEQRAIQLADGSIAHVNSDAKLTIRYTKAQRVIELNEGQALFDVFHDTSRPFVVRTGAADIVAVGTKFEVYRKVEGTTVTVVEGKVKVLDRDWPVVGSAPRELPQGNAETPLSLSAGQQVELNARSAPRPVAVNAELATAWIRREVAFAGQPLGEVAKEFNRYISTPIVIEDFAISQYRISGVFQTYDLDSFIAYLREFETIEVERTQQQIRVKPRPRPLPSSVVAGEKPDHHAVQ